ncbi:MAG: hydroxyacid dehydrogenase [Candidatus Dactylopiibacterium sp.]|nr:hydroxyacid dehydrogenase [Candidatus Dactylopiibacterium sp.]
MRARVLITEFMEASAVARLGGEFDVTYAPDLVDRPGELLAAARGVSALIVRNRTQVRGALLEHLAPAGVIGRLGVGLDNIDLAAAQRRGIRVIPAVGANARPVAEYVIATALRLLRGGFEASAEVSGGQWPRAALSGGREIGGRQLGLIGFGVIGQLVARFARALDMHVVACDPALHASDAIWPRSGVTPIALEVLLATSDVISLHLPLLPETHHLLDATRLARVKPGAILINTARGGIVDEAAVADALRSGRLGGAALDVFQTEPLPAGSPLSGAPNLILTPHIAGLTEESNLRVSQLIAERVAAALRPEAPTHAAH